MVLDTTNLKLLLLALAKPSSRLLQSHVHSEQVKSLFCFLFLVVVFSEPHSCSLFNVYSLPLPQSSSQLRRDVNTALRSTHTRTNPRES